MFKEYKIDRYFDIPSDIHSLNPVYKVISLFVVLISIFLTSSLHDLLFVLFTLVFILKLSNIPYKIYIKNVLGLKYLLLFIIIINLIFGMSLLGTVISIFQIVSIVCYTSMITYTTPPMEIAYGLEKSLGFLKGLRIPIDKLSLSLTLVLRFIPSIYEQASRIMKSQATRGVDFYNSNLKGKITAISTMLIPMFMLSFKKSEDVADIMSVRLYGYSNGRTNYRMNEWTLIDSLMLVINGLILIAVILL